MTSASGVLRFWSTLALSLAGLLCAASAWAQSAESLRTNYQTMRQALARSLFGRPLVLDYSGRGGNASHGDVHAVLVFPFPVVAAALGRAANWCDMLLLQTNVKRCTPAQGSGGESLQVAIGRKFELPIEDAFVMDFRYLRRANDPEYFAAQLSAHAGPLATRDYRIAVEAIPVGSDQTFVRMSYTYESSAFARIATDAYLATAGRGKVGFTVTGRDGGGRPTYVGGVQGIAERNTMRYFLAIEAYLDALDAPADTRLERRMRHWFAGTERYARQLREMTLDAYLAMKRREARPAREPPGPGASTGPRRS